MENRLFQAKVLEETPIVSTEGLEVSLGGFKALRGVNFKLYRGELRFVTGPKGAGKTTLLDALCGKVKPVRGSVHVNGAAGPVRCPECRIARLGCERKFVASSVFASLNIRDHLLLSMKQTNGLYDVLRARTEPHQQDKIMDVLRTVGLENKHLEHSTALTQGEKLRLAIGMLLIRDPEVLLLDEPFTGLTAEEKEQTGELLRRICSEHSVIVAERDMELAERFAHTITMMHEGTIIAERTIEENRLLDKAAPAYLEQTVEGQYTH